MSYHSTLKRDHDAVLRSIRLGLQTVEVTLAPFMRLRLVRGSAKSCVERQLNTTKLIFQRPLFSQHLFFKFSNILVKVPAVCMILPS